MNGHCLVFSVGQRKTGEEGGIGVGLLDAHAGKRKPARRSHIAGQGVDEGERPHGIALGLPARERLDQRQRRRPFARNRKRRSEEHTSELQSLMRISYAVFCLKKKIQLPDNIKQTHKYKNTSKQTT